MSGCTYKAEKNKKRNCQSAKETICNGTFSCDMNRSCTLTVPCGQTMILAESLLNAAILCHGALGYECEDQIVWGCDPKYLKGAIQFSSTNVKDCNNLVNQGRYNRDGMDCRCKTCDVRFCANDKLFCDCSVETFPITDTTNTLTVDGTSTTAYSIPNTKHTTAIDMRSTEVSTYNTNTTVSTTVVSSERINTISSAGTTYTDTSNTSSSVREITTVADSYTDAGPDLHQAPVSSSANAGLLGGVLGGLSVVVIICILLLALLVHRKRIQKRKKQKEHSEKMLLESFTQSTDVPNKPIPMLSTMLQEPGGVNTQPVATSVNSAVDLPDNDNYYSAPDNNDQQRIQMQHDAQITQDDEYVFANPVENFSEEQTYYNESNFNSTTQNEFGGELYMNARKSYGKGTPDDTQVNEDVYNVLNESEKNSKEGDEEYGHLRVVNAGRGGTSEDVEDEYDELNKSAKQRFAEVDDTYDHTGTSDVYGDQNVNTAYNPKGNFAPDDEYDHVVSY